MFPAVMFLCYCCCCFSVVEGASSVVAVVVVINFLANPAIDSLQLKRCESIKLTYLTYIQFLSYFLQG